MPRAKFHRPRRTKRRLGATDRIFCWACGRTHAVGNSGKRRSSNIKRCWSKLLTVARDCEEWPQPTKVLFELSDSGLQKTRVVLQCFDAFEALEFPELQPPTNAVDLWIEARLPGGPAFVPWLLDLCERHYETTHKVSHKSSLDRYHASVEELQKIIKASVPEIMPVQNTKPSIKSKLF